MKALASPKVRKRKERVISLKGHIYPKQTEKGSEGKAGKQELTAGAIERQLKAGDRGVR